MKKKPNPQSAFFKTGLLPGVFVFLAGVFLVFLRTSADSGRPSGEANGSGRTVPVAPNAGARSLARVTPNGMIIENFLDADRQALTRVTLEEHALRPLGNTLWQVDDKNAIADGVTIDTNDAWGAWTLEGARLGAYPIDGNGTPDFEFSSFGSGNSGVASAKEPIASPSWNRMPRGAISGFMALSRPVAVYRTGRFRFRSATRIFRPAQGR